MSRGNLDFTGPNLPQTLPPPSPQPFAFAAFAAPWAWGLGGVINGLDMDLVMQENQLEQWAEQALIREAEAQYEEEDPPPDDTTSTFLLVIYSSSSVG